MLVICCYSTKGGVGKTTIAAHLAVAAESAGDGPVAIIDTDPQASLSNWWNVRSAETPTFVQTTLADLPKNLAALRDAGCKLVLIDTPGADISHSRQVLKLSDLVLVPSRPSPLDLGTLGATVSTVQEEGKPLMFVLNAVTARTRISTQAVMALSHHGAVGAILHQRTDYAAAMTDGRVAAELDSSSKSAEEIAELWNGIKTYLRKDAKKDVRPSTRKRTRKEANA
jgi:chromosome partitioning protein